jgi:hypothetical protein
LDWKKSFALFLETPSTGPGAHKLKLAMSFATVHARTEILYTRITTQAIDTDHASLDNKPVELEITQPRFSSSNPSQYPADLTSEDYDAYSVTIVGDESRTRVAIIVRRDTAVSKLLNRTTPTDKLRIRGTARIPRNPSALSIVADSAEPM